MIESNISKFHKTYWHAISLMYKPCSPHQTKFQLLKLMEFIFKITGMQDSWKSTQFLTPINILAPLIKYTPNSNAIWMLPRTTAMRFQMEWLIFPPNIVYLTSQWCFTWLVVFNPPFKNHPSNDGHNGFHFTFSLVQPKQK